MRPLLKGIITGQHAHHMILCPSTGKMYLHQTTLKRMLPEAEAGAEATELGIKVQQQAGSGYRDSATKYTAAIVRADVQGDRRCRCFLAMISPRAHALE